MGKGATSEVGNISSALLMCGRGVHSCLETIDVCIWHMFVVVTMLKYVCIVRCGAVGARVCEG